jgi:hypothetical protein
VWLLARCKHRLHPAVAIDATVALQVAPHLTVVEQYAISDRIF